MPRGLPATISRPIMAELRERLGFDGLVVTDALIMDGALVGRRESDAAVEAVQAGVDLLLYPNDARRVRDALEQALASGTLAPARLAESLPPLRARARAGDQPDAAGDAAARSIRPTRWPTHCWRRECCAAALRRSAARSIWWWSTTIWAVPIRPARATGSIRCSARTASAATTAGSRVVLAFAEPRAWKGRSGFGAASRDALANAVPGADLIVLFGHPRLCRSSRPMLRCCSRGTASG